MAEVKPSDVSKLALDLLAKNKGIFIGEEHDSFLAYNFVSSNLETFKKAGVTTLYVEYSMYKAKAAQGGDSCRQMYLDPSDNPTLKIKPSSMATLVDVATKAGIRVIGHDSVVGNNLLVDTDESLRKRVASGGVAMDKRDDFAAEVIKGTHDGGKYIVYGGGAHSGNEIGDRPSGKGLSERLGIPSIDFHSTGAFGAREDLVDKAKIIFKGVREIVSGTSSIHLLAGKDGESTHKVFSLSDSSLMTGWPDISDAQNKKAQALAKQIKDSGQCKMPTHLQGRELLDTRDIENLARDLKKPEATTQGLRKF